MNKNKNKSESESESENGSESESDSNIIGGAHNHREHKMQTKLKKQSQRSKQTKQTKQKKQHSSTNVHGEKLFQPNFTEAQKADIAKRMVIYLNSTKIAGLLTQERALQMINMAISKIITKEPTRKSVKEMLRRSIIETIVDYYNLGARMALERKNVNNKK